MSELLAIYLRDHHAGACAGVRLAHRAADGVEVAGNELKLVAHEIDEDLDSLEQIMTALGVAPSNAKDTLATVAERIGRLKLNGRVLGRSPLSSVVELEALAAGIRGKEALWRTLLLVKASHPPLEQFDLDRLIERAQSQRETVEACSLEAARRAFGAADRAHA
jgi:hypothetical protein